MKIIKTTLNHNLSLNKYLISNNSCFLDIETTGLNSSKDIIYLIGILYFDNEINSWTLKQLFANEINYEEVILIEMINMIQSFDTLITYNGNAFDIPFINSRLKYYNINYEISKENSFDLYLIVKENRYYLELENLKLKTLERYLGILREDIYSGKDCIEFYYNYIESKDEEFMRRLLNHNFDDLFYMLDTIRIIDIIHSLKTFTLNIKGSNIDFLIEKIKQKGDTLVFNGNIIGDLNFKILYYGHNYKLSIDELNNFQIYIESRKGMITPEKECLFICKEDYSITNIEDKTIYKVPDNIILLKAGKNYCLQNIKEILSDLISKIRNNITDSK